MQPAAIGILVDLDLREDTGEGNEESIKEVKESFVSMKGDLGVLRIFGKNLRKIALNGRMSLIEKHLYNLRTNLKSFKTCVLF